MPKLVQQATMYELRYTHTVHHVSIDVHFEGLLNAGLSPRDIDAYWKRAVPLNLNGIESITLSMGDHLLHACAYIHYHCSERLNWLTDIVCIVRDRTDQVARCADFHALNARSAFRRRFEHRSSGRYTT